MSWSLLKLNREARKVFTTCCFCSFWTCTRVLPCRFDAKVCLTRITIPKGLRDLRRALLRSVRTIWDTFCSLAILLTAKSSSSFGSSKYAAIHRYQPPYFETSIPAFLISVRIFISADNGKKLCSLFSSFDRFVISLFRLFSVRAFSIRTLSSVPLTCACVVMPSITTNTQGKLVPVFAFQWMRANKKGGAFAPLVNNTLRVKVRLRCYKLLRTLHYVPQKILFIVF